MAESKRITFSVNSYDRDGDRTEQGIYLHMDRTRILIAKDMKGLDGFIDTLQAIKREIVDSFLSVYLPESTDGDK